MEAKLFKAAYYVLIGILVALGILLVGIQISVIEGYELKIVQSGSMEPEIKTGSLILIQARDSYELGEVITFGKDDAENVPTTHRVIKVEAEDGAHVYYTKGDANEEADNRPVREREVIGRVLLDIPYLGFILDFARQPLGFALLIGVPALVVVYDEAVKIVAELRRQREGKTEHDAET